MLRVYWYLVGCIPGLNRTANKSGQPLAARFLASPRVPLTARSPPCCRRAPPATGGARGAAAATPGCRGLLGRQAHLRHELLLVGHHALGQAFEVPQALARLREEFALLFL